MPFGKKKVGEREVDFTAIFKDIFEPAIREAKTPEGKALIPAQTDMDAFSSSINQVNIIARMRLGLALKRDGKHYEALEECITITKLAPGYGEAWKEKGVVEGLIARKVPKGSRPAWLPDGYDSLKRATMLIPEDFDVWSSLGGVLKNVRGDLATARQMYAHTANISDGHPYPLLNALKLMARDTGKLNLAPVREQLEKAAKLRLAQTLTTPPSDPPWCYFDLVEINLYQGNKKGFLDYVKKGIDLLVKAIESYKKA